MGFLGALKWVVTNPLTALMGVGCVGLTIWAFTLMFENTSLQRDSVKMTIENGHLKTEKQALSESVDTLKTSIELTKKAQADLSDAIGRLAAREQKTQDNLEKIDAAPPTDDAPVAPVLRDTLDRLRGH